MYITFSIVKGFEMTLNYWVVVERYSFPNGVVAGSIPDVKSSLYLTKNQKNKKTS